MRIQRWKVRSRLGLCGGRGIVWGWVGSSAGSVHRGVEDTLSELPPIHTRQLRV